MPASRGVSTRFLAAVLAVLGVWPVPPYMVDPQAPGALPTPNLKDSLRLVNILFRRPVGPKSVRQECRMLNATEFDRITETINRAKRDTRIRPNVYDAFAYLHTHPKTNTGAHQGPGFLPYHRVFVFLFERLLRLYDPTVSLCYWDSTLEPKDVTASASWTSAFYGNNMGAVSTGFAANWPTPLGPLTRKGGKLGRPFRQHDIDEILQSETLGEISYPGGKVGQNLEKLHNYVHRFVGGLMGQVETASYDPIFWFHHTFVDCIYEWFRQNQIKKGINPMRDWPTEYGEPAHAPYAAMRLGRLRMIDGTNNYFPEETLQCMDPVGPCESDYDCGIHMRCDISSARCVSDTLGMTSENVDEQMNHLDTLFTNPGVAMKTINRFLKLPPRGFSQLFGVPNLQSFS